MTKLWRKKVFCIVILEMIFQHKMATITKKE